MNAQRTRPQALFSFAALSPRDGHVKVAFDIAGFADRSEVDFDLFVYDENNDLVQWDEAPDSDALCRVTPRWSGRFHLVVTSAPGSSSYKILVDP
jgi:hypothetical protein